MGINDYFRFLDMYGSNFSVFYGDTIQITNIDHQHYGKYATVVENDLSVEMMFTRNRSVVVKEITSGKRLNLTGDDFKVINRTYNYVPNTITYRRACNGYIYSIKRVHENSSVYVILEQHNNTSSSERVCRSSEFIIRDLLSNNKYTSIDGSEFNKHKRNFIFNRELSLVKIGKNDSEGDMFNAIVVKGVDLTNTISRLLHEHPLNDVNVYSLNDTVLTRLEYYHSIEVAFKEK